MYAFEVISLDEITCKRTGLLRKEDGKPCVTSVTIILFEIAFRQSLLSFKQMFL